MPASIFAKQWEVFMGYIGVLEINVYEALCSLIVINDRRE